MYYLCNTLRMLVELDLCHGIESFISGLFIKSQKQTTKVSTWDVIRVSYDQYISFLTLKFVNQNDNFFFAGTITKSCRGHCYYYKTTDQLALSLNNKNVGLITDTCI